MKFNRNTTSSHFLFILRGWLGTLQSEGEGVAHWWNNDDNGEGKLEIINLALIVSLKFLFLLFLPLPSIVLKEYRRSLKGNVKDAGYYEVQLFL